MEVVQRGGEHSMSLHHFNLQNKCVLFVTKKLKKSSNKI